MPHLVLDGHNVRYEICGPDHAPTFVLLNGLTQYAELWSLYGRTMSERGYRVVTFDLLGQGESDKPALFIDQDELVRMTGAILEHTAPGGPVYLAGISFGGLIALRYAIENSHRLSGLVAMSTFAELSPQLQLIGNALRTGLILGGVSYLQDLLLPMNVSDEWLRPVLDKLDAVKRPGWLINDLYALQNLMESFLGFNSLAAELGRISVPTLVLNGEFDFLTPRSLHDQIRLGIENSALVIVPHGYHAFTLEYPQLTSDLLCNFADDVSSARFQGAQSVWIAREDGGGAIDRFPAGFDHMRAIPVRKGESR